MVRKSGWVTLDSHWCPGTLEGKMEQGLQVSRVVLPQFRKKNVPPLQSPSPVAYK